MFLSLKLHWYQIALIPYRKKSYVLCYMYLGLIWSSRTFRQHLTGAALFSQSTPSTLLWLFKIHQFKSFFTVIFILFVILEIRKILEFSKKIFFFCFLLPSQYHHSNIFPKRFCNQFKSDFLMFWVLCDQNKNKIYMILRYNLFLLWSACFSTSKHLTAFF